MPSRLSATLSAWRASAARSSRALRQEGPGRPVSRFLQPKRSLPLLGLLFALVAAPGLQAQQPASAAASAAPKVAPASQPASVAATPASAAVAPASAASGTWKAAPNIKMPTKGTADHTKFKELQGPFASGSEVTKVCLSCHTEAATQVMGTRHWTWDYTNPDTGQVLGKKTMLNGFCIGNRSNEPLCQGCHIGYGWKDKNFDFKDQSKVDCLVCHNTLGGYKKMPGTGGEVPVVRTENPPGSGKFIEPVDLALVAQHVGKTSNRTCGSCHFLGGGGDGVKHGDLDTSLNKADKALDVHMASKAKGGQGFQCATCHQADSHAIAGSRINMTASDPHGARIRGDGMSGRNAATCQSCHGDKPHKESLLDAQRLNNHSNKLACQTCHVPAMARGGIATKMTWDWQKAGQLKDGKPFMKKDEKGNVVYDSKKGSFTFGENVVPDYIWFNGKVSYTLQGEKINPKELVKINRFLGSPDDPNARVWPVKRFIGNQPYDTVNNVLLVPHVTGAPADAAYWNTFDWNKALDVGAKATDTNFSGKYDFVKTEMIWPITHMVAPKDKAVACIECHSPNGRLKDVPGLYVPGQVQFPWLERIGWIAAGLAVLGVLLHATLRLLSRNKKTSGV